MTLHLLGRNAGATMRQPKISSIPRNEVGFTICRTPTGSLTRGPMAMGTPVAVNIPLQCPKGSKMEGLYHTHPGGVAYPSNTDIKSAQRHGAKVLCITNDSQTRCFKVRGRKPGGLTIR